MRNPWTMKMEQFTSFSGEQRDRLDALISSRQQDYAADEDILVEGQEVDECHVLLSGLAARYKLLPDGGRQIMAFLVPGDLCDAEVFILQEMDHSVCTLSPTTCAIIPAQTMRGLLREVSCLSEALWWGTMTDLAVLRERIVDIGRREARERIAHLIYEMLVRYRVVGETDGGAIPWPITQDELADATGLSVLHVNRTLNQLREDGLIDFGRRELTVIEPEKLRVVAGFNANYLHLRRTEQRDGPVAKRTGDLV